MLTQKFLCTARTLLSDRTHARAGETVAPKVIAQLTCHAQQYKSFVQLKFNLSTTRKKVIYNRLAERAVLIYKPQVSLS